MDRIAKIIGGVAALAILAAAGYFFYLLVVSSDQTRLAVLTAIVSVCTLVYTQHLNSKREIASRQFSKKAEAYEEIIGAMTSLMDASRLGMESSQDELLERLAKIMPKILIWGGPDVLKAWIKLSTPDENPMAALIAGSALVTALRKELGHTGDAALGPLGALSAMIRHEDRETAEPA